MTKAKDYGRDEIERIEDRKLRLSPFGSAMRELAPGLTFTEVELVPSLRWRCTVRARELAAVLEPQKWPRGPR